MRPPSRFPRPLLLAAGLLLMLLGVLLSPLPGPGGMVFGVPGAILVLRHSPVARRLFVRGKRRWPRLGAFADRALRRHRRPAKSK
jgi:hypothetical protein